MRLTKRTLVTLAIAAATSLAFAQQPPTLKVYSRETVVDVTVTDKNGKPVPGLRQSDFSIEEDGKPQTIRSFEEFSQNNKTTTRTPRKLPADVYTNLQTETGPLNVFLLDDINGGDILQARWAARDFIKSMAPGTRVALLALGDRLTVLQGPTADPDRLLKVVNNAVNPYFVEAAGCTKQVLLDWATLDQLHAVAAYLSGIKGRKNLIWVGKGTPDLIFPSGCQDWKLPLQQTYDLLEDAEVTIYPLDPSGVGKLGQQQLAMEAVAEATGGTAYYENNDIKALMAKAVDTGTSYYTLSYVPPSLAYDGRYHTITVQLDRPDLHLLYRKGYSTEDPTQLAHPPETILGFKSHEAQPAIPSANPLDSAMSPVAPPADQLLFDVRVDPTPGRRNPADPSVIGQLDPKLKKLALTRYDLLFALPQSQIAFADSGGGTYSGSLTFEVAAFDPDGRLQTIRSQTMTLPLTNEEYREFIQKPFQFFLQLDLPPGQSTLRAGILDAVSNKMGTVEIPLTVPKQ